MQSYSRAQSFYFESEKNEKKHKKNTEQKLY